MKDETKAFLSEGMAKYNNAFRTMRSFEKDIEKRLKKILEQRAQRDKWGKFSQTDRRPISSRNTVGEPSLRANTTVSHGHTETDIWIYVEWKDDEADYAHYAARLKNSNRDPLIEQMQGFDWNDGPGELLDGRLCLHPNPSDFDLDRDVGALLDQLVTYMDWWADRETDSSSQ